MYSEINISVFLSICNFRRDIFIRIINFLMKWKDQLIIEIYFENIKVFMLKININFFKVEG